MIYGLEMLEGVGKPCWITTTAVIAVTVTALCIPAAAALLNP